MKLRSIVLIVAGIMQSSLAAAQGVYFDPSPTDVTSNEVRLYIDITSSDCDCPELLDADPETNPLFIWAWNPNEDRPELEVDGQTFNVGNSLSDSFEDSNDNLKLTQDPENPDLWYFDFLGASMVQFYGVPAAQFYESGIDFLIKEKVGSPADLPQQKSPDINIIPEPIGCFDKVCAFPTTFFQNDFFAILYDTKKEANPGLQGGDAYFARFQYKVNGGPYQILEITDDSMVEMDPEGDGVFSLTMIPQDFFGLGENDVLNELRVSFTKPPSDQAPYSSAVSLFPGCP